MRSLRTHHHHHINLASNLDHIRKGRIFVEFQVGPSNSGLFRADLGIGVLNGHLIPCDFKIGILRDQNVKCRIIGSPGNGIPSMIELVNFDDITSVNGFVHSSN